MNNTDMEKRTPTYQGSPPGDGSPRAGDVSPRVNTKKNYLYNVLCEVITTLIPLITTPYVTRILGTDGLGSYNYVMTIASYFVLLANFGVKAYGNRCIAQVKDDTEARSRVFSGIYYQQLILSLTAGTLYAVYAAAFGGEYKVIFLVFGINLLSAVMEVTWLYYGMEVFAPAAFAAIGTKLLSAAGIFLFVKNHDDLWLYTVLCSGSVIAVQIILWCGVHKYVRFVRVPFAEIRKHFLPCLALLVPMFAPTLYRSMDKLMLEYIVGKDAVGLYGAAEQLQTCMLGFITGLSTVMLPRVSNLLAHGKDAESRQYLGSSLQFSLFIGCAFAFGIGAAAQVFVPYYYGQGFAEAALLTTVLSPTIFFISWAEVIRSQYIIPRKMDRIFLISVLVGGSVNLLCNAALIGTMAEHSAAGLSRFGAGALGALPGTLLAELSVILVQYIFLHKELPYLTFIRTCLIFPIAGGIMFVIVRLIGSVLTAHLGSMLMVLFCEVAAGAAVYLAITGGWYFIFRRETLKQLFSRK
ncbi:MAG: oligosaccharide flippase family protein [Clostridia bacterium]|nr:oligosaccharide flippase family protein [Clostridia bacterium]